MNPADKRLAVRTDDHPLEYAKFEGVIPPGQYGAGTVMVWDLGKYEPLENQPLEEQLVRGKIHIVLLGEKTARRRKAGGMIGNRQRYRHLAIDLLAQLTAILVVHADRMVRSGWVRQDEIVLRVQSY